MGCDIHLSFEKKNKSGKWEKIDVQECLIPDDRCYILFSFLANVRTNPDCKTNGQIADRGIPEDCLDKEYFQSEDIHSATHAYLDEILRLPWNEAELDQCYFYLFCKHIIPRLVNFHRTLSNDDEKSIRIIIGFDN